MYGKNTSRYAKRNYRKNWNLHPYMRRWWPRKRIIIGRNRPSWIESNEQWEMCMNERSSREYSKYPESKWKSSHFIIHGLLVHVWTAFASRKSSENSKIYALRDVVEQHNLKESFDHWKLRFSSQQSKRKNLENADAMCIQWNILRKWLGKIWSTLDFMCLRCGERSMPKESRRDKMKKWQRNVMSRGSRNTPSMLGNFAYRWEEMNTRWDIYENFIYFL